MGPADDQDNSTFGPLRRHQSTSLLCTHLPLIVILHPPLRGRYSTVVQPRPYHLLPTLDTHLCWSSQSPHQLPEDSINKTRHSRLPSSHTSNSVCSPLIAPYESPPVTASLNRYQTLTTHRTAANHSHSCLRSSPTLPLSSSFTPIIPLNRQVLLTCLPSTLPHAVHASHIFIACGHYEGGQRLDQKIRYCSHRQVVNFIASKQLSQRQPSHSESLSCFSGRMHSGLTYT